MRFKVIKNLLGRNDSDVAWFVPYNENALLKDTSDHVYTSFEAFRNENWLSFHDLNSLNRFTSDFIKSGKNFSPESTGLP